MMKTKFKRFIKKNFSSEILELVAPKFPVIIKEPRKKSVVSDLFTLRIEDGWETYLAFKLHEMLNPGSGKKNSAVYMYFFDKKGNFIAKDRVAMSFMPKKTILINEIASKFNIQKDGTFAVFHDNSPIWLERYGSFLADRGYIGYSNPQRGLIKNFVHGNFDAIALDAKNKTSLLGNSSLFKKEYRLQHYLDKNFEYEFFWVNTTNKPQVIQICTVSENDSFENEIQLYPGGLGTFKSKNKIATRIIIKSRLYLARPIIFKYMSTSFDIFHG